MVNFSKDDVVYFIKSRPIFVLGAVIILVSTSGFVFKNRIVNFFKTEVINYPASPEVTSPTIIDGELVLPKVMLKKFGAVSSKESQIHVLSANLFGVFDSQQTADSRQQTAIGGQQQAQKLVGIRIVGEMLNTGKNITTEISPVVRFLNSDNSEIARKVGRLTPGFDFFGVTPNGKTLYDVIVDNPPQAEKMEVTINSAAATTSAKFEVLKILNQEIEVKVARNQGNRGNQGDLERNSSVSGQASGSAVASASAMPAGRQGGPAGSEGEVIEPADTKALAGEASEIEYYTVSGSVMNSLTDPVSDIAVYVWVKDSSGHVFSFGRQDFKGDLISPKNTVDFKINLFPFKDGEKYNKYEVRAWGKRYTL